MPVVMHFSTFLKYFTLSDGDKLRELQKYANPGGFDFYRPSRDAITTYFGHGQTAEQAERLIAATSAANNEQHNLDVFRSAQRWGDGQSIVRQVRNRGVWRSPQQVFSVHIEPEFIIRRGGRETIVAVYPRGSSALSRDDAGAGIILLRRAYRGTGEEAFGIYDAPAARAFWTPTNVSEDVLDNVVRFIDQNLPRFVD